MDRIVQRLILTVVFVSIWPSTFALSQSTSGCENALYPVTKIGLRATVKAYEGSFPLDVNTRMVPASTATQTEGSRYVRVLIEVVNQGKCTWYVTIRDESRHVIQTLTRDDFARTSSRWSKRVPGNRAIINFYRCPSTPIPQIQITEMIQMPMSAKNTYYSSKRSGVPDWQPLYENVESVSKPAGDYRSTGDYVGLVMSSDGDEAWVCTGVMIAKDLLLTNWHCGSLDPSMPEKNWSPEIVKDTIIDLSFDDDDSSREFMAIECVVKDRDYDFAVLRIAPIDTRDTPKAAPISLARLSKGQGIQMVHHPSGEPKRISFLGCNVLDPQYSNWKIDIKSDFTHQCDTERGSSGAPVFNLMGELVGLHHLGYGPAKNGQCDYRNKAVSIKSIVARIRRKSPQTIRELQLVHD